MGSAADVAAPSSSACSAGAPRRRVRIPPTSGGCSPTAPTCTCSARSAPSASSTWALDDFRRRARRRTKQPGVVLTLFTSVEAGSARSAWPGTARAAAACSFEIVGSGQTPSASADRSTGIRSCTGATKLFGRVVIDGAALHLLTFTVGGDFLPLRVRKRAARSGWSCGSLPVSALHSCEVALDVFGWTITATGASRPLRDRP